MSDRRLRSLISALLIVAAALFAIGVAIELHDIRAEAHRARAEAPRTVLVAALLLADADQGKETHAGSSSQTTSVSAGSSSREPSARSGTETAAERAQEHRNATGHESAAQIARETGRVTRHESPAQIAHERGAERILGVNPDSTVLVTLAVTASLVLALALWLTSGIGPAVAVTAFAIGATVLDALELAHQINESRTSLIVIAASVGLLHLAAAVSALLLIRRRRAPGTLVHGLSRA